MPEMPTPQATALLPVEMTLRDYFASQYLKMKLDLFVANGGRLDFDKVARDSYDFAYFMMKARRQKGKVNG